jgi:serine phosphatase RsbU (regulator of sigma subunit)
LLQLDTLATVLVGRLEPASGTTGEEARRFRFSNAGHPPPLLVGEDGTVSVLEQEFGNPLLGVGVLFRTEDVVVLEPEATIVLYTDGLVERRGQSLEDGISRLKGVLAELAGAGPEDLCDGILARMMPERPEDDVALLVAKLRPLHRQTARASRLTKE